MKSMDMVNGRWLDNPFRDERIMRIRDGLKERNEVKVGEWFLVRVPQIEGRIFLRKNAGEEGTAHRSAGKGTVNQSAWIKAGRVPC